MYIRYHKECLHIFSFYENSQWNNSKPLSKCCASSKRSEPFSASSELHLPVDKVDIGVHLIWIHCSTCQTCTSTLQYITKHCFILLRACYITCDFRITPLLCRVVFIAFCLKFETCYIVLLSTNAS